MSAGLIEAIAIVCGLVGFGALLNIAVVSLLGDE